MAKFKNKDILVLQDEELLLGNAQEASIKYDGSDLVINKVPYHDVEGYLATQQFVNDALLGLDWQESVLSITSSVPETGGEGDRYIAVVPSGVSWDPSNTHASVALSNENLTATGDTPASWRNTVANIEKFTGKWYWEITIDTWPVTSFMIGIGHVDIALQNFPGGGATSGYGYYDNNGQLYFNGSGSSYGDSYGLNDVIGVAMDLDNGKVWFSKNDVWQNSGDPVAGTGEAGTFTPAEGWSPVMAITTDAAAATLNVGSTAWAGTLPTGYTGIGDTGVVWFDGDVLEWETSSYTITTPSAGFTLWVEDEGVYYTYNNSWVKMGTVVDHSNLLNLDVDDHTQYLNVTRHDLTARHGSAVVDHGLIGGLGDDDHAQYLTTGRHDTTDRHGSSVVDHGLIGGLADDDHTQYLPMSGGRAMTGDLDLDSYNLTTTGYVSAGTLYGEGSSITGLDTDHGNLTGLADDDHTQYLHTDGRRPWDGTLTVSSTGSQIQFTEDFAYIGVSSNTDLLTLSPTGVIIDGDISATTFGGAGFDHDLITNTHDLTTDIDHDTITNAHNLTTNIDHDTITNAHNLTTDIDHNDLTNTHNLNVDIDHGSIGGLAGDDHPQYFLLSSSASVSGDILAGTAGLDIGSVGTPFSDIYCDTLHTSAGSVIIGTATLTEVGGVLTTPSLSAALLYGDGSNLTDVVADLSVNVDNIGIEEDTNILELKDNTVIFEHQQSAGVAGGNSSASAWNDLPINTEVYDPNGWGSISTNRMTLAAGTWRIRAAHVMYDTNEFKSRIYDVTNTSYYYGFSQRQGTAANCSSTTSVETIITSGTTFSFDYEYYCTASATNGLGLGVGDQTEVYGRVVCERVK